MNTLPPELLLRVFSFLAPRDVVRSSFVSKEFCALARDRALWKEVFVRARNGRNYAAWPVQQLVVDANSGDPLELSRVFRNVRFLHVYKGTPAAEAEALVSAFAGHALQNMRLPVLNPSIVAVLPPDLQALGLPNGVRRLLLGLFTRCQQLRHVTVFVRDGRRAFQALAMLPHLEHLNLFCLISSPLREGVAPVNLPRLTALHLGCNHTPQGFGAMFPNLEWLFCYGKFNDQSTAALAKAMPKLEVLSALSPDFSDTGLALVRQACPSLGLITVATAQITAEGVTAAGLTPINRSGGRFLVGAHVPRILHLQQVFNKNMNAVFRMESCEAFDEKDALTSDSEHESDSAPLL